MPMWARWVFHELLRVGVRRVGTFFFLQVGWSEQIWALFHLLQFLPLVPAKLPCMRQTSWQVTVLCMMSVYCKCKPLDKMCARMFIREKNEFDIDLFQVKIPLPNCEHCLVVHLYLGRSCEAHLCSYLFYWLAVSLVWSNANGGFCNYNAGHFHCLCNLLLQDFFLEKWPRCQEVGVGAAIPNVTLFSPEWVFKRAVARVPFYWFLIVSGKVTKNNFALNWALSSANISLVMMGKITRQCPESTCLEQEGNSKQAQTRYLSICQPSAIPLGQTNLLSMQDLIVCMYKGFLDVRFTFWTWVT